jgi:hydrogenase maturation protease
MNRGARPLALVAAIGNPDRGDDGFGPAVARRLRARILHQIEIVEPHGDALALVEAWDAFRFAIVIDAMAPIGEPGRIHRLDLTNNPLPIGLAADSSHAFGIAQTVELARSLGRLPQFLVAYLAEGERFEPGASLSPAVADAVEKVAGLVANEIATMLTAKESSPYA